MPEASLPRSGLLLLCYVPVFALIPWVAAAEDREIRWHARNGSRLFGVAAAGAVVATIAGFLVPSIGCLYGVVMLVLAFVYGLVALLAGVKALKGERLIVPGISPHGA